MQPFTKFYCDVALYNINTERAVYRSVTFDFKTETPEYYAKNEEVKLFALVLHCLLMESMVNHNAFTSNKNS